MFIYQRVSKNMWTNIKKIWLDFLVEHVQCRKSLRICPTTIGMWTFNQHSHGQRLVHGPKLLVGFRQEVRWQQQVLKPKIDIRVFADLSNKNNKCLHKHRVYQVTCAMRKGLFEHIWTWAICIAFLKSVLSFSKPQLLKKERALEFYSPLPQNLAVAHMIFWDILGTSENDTHQLSILIGKAIRIYWNCG